ncbi:DEAD/DEAH box helicase [Peptostreptococcus faecalis]|uniref:DEAD/DEAH box helicase n=1 Tax=Peptostreptococcus faecalis TaxID=2045015 RepID=UPI000C7B34C7|nr:DEAD/DEAH box helicase [Peptostreptococcus faecalis]
MNFNNMNINSELVSVLNNIGINSPTEIQKKAIPDIINGKNLIAKSNTGTGKTLSFLIPILNNLVSKNKQTSLILVPTRELAIQVFNEAERIIQKLDIKNDGINILALYGGRDIQSQINKLKKDIDIIVATPGRLLDHLNRKTINLTKIDILVIDEVDQMLLMGFMGEIDRVIKNIKNTPQLLCFSATVDSKVKKLAYRYSDNIQIIGIDDNHTLADLIEQEFIFTTDRDKFDDLCKIIDRDNPFMAIIFCRTKARVDNLDLKLSQKKYNCAKIHSDISQSKRERIIKDFRNLKTQFLISTDLSSRGLDIEGITHIYNYDLPDRLEDYIHRVGRTGRIGKDGKACSFVTDKNTDLYELIQKKLL